MNIKKGIFWDKPLSLVEGCTPVSEGCENCWLRDIENRFGRTWDGSVKFRADRLAIPLRTRKPTVFAVWSDLYHEGVTDEEDIQEAIDTMITCPDHTFLIITKRIQRAAYILRNEPTLTDNIWHIVTCENQQMADKRIPHLLQIPGKRGIIIEPMLGPVDLGTVFGKCQHPEWRCDQRDDDLGGNWCLNLFANTCPAGEDIEEPIHQVILGGENVRGKGKARPMDIEWALAVKNQCDAAGVPFFFKGKGSANKGDVPEELVNAKELAWRKE